MKPFGNGPMDEVFNAIATIEDEAVQETLKDLLEQHRKAVDTERESTDETEKLTAAGQVKTIADAINEALAEAGLNVAFKAPADKPEMPAKA